MSKRLISVTLLKNNKVTDIFCRVDAESARKKLYVMKSMAIMLLRASTAEKELERTRRRIVMFSEKP